MFDIDPHNMYDEIRRAEEFRGLHMTATDELRYSYHGPYYRADRRSMAPMPENHAYQWLSLITPRVVYDNPMVKVSSRASGASRDLLLRMKHAINIWAKSQNLWRTLLEVWYDAAFAFGIVRTVLTDIPGYKGIRNPDGSVILPQWPVCRRVAPEQFFIDSMATNFDAARFMGHVWCRDKEDLLAASGFNHDVITELSPDSDLDKFYGEKGISDRPSRKQIVGYEIWVPEYTLPEVAGDPRYNGTILTMAVDGNPKKNGEPKWIRDPRPYFGPRWGPYTMFGIYNVPNCVYPLSPLAATHEQIKELNAHAVAASRGAASFKRFVAYNPSNPNAGIQAKNANNGDVVAIENLGEDFQQVNVGGNDQSQYQYIAMLHERAERATGLNEVARGNVVSDVSATQSADAASQRESRTSFVERMIETCTTDVLDTVGWLLYNSEFARFDLGDQASKDLYPRPASLPPESEADAIAAEIETGEREDDMGLGGLPFQERVEAIRQQLKWQPKAMFPHEGDQYAMQSMSEISGVDYEELQLIIEPMSMKRTDQMMMQRQAQEMVAFATNLAQVAVANPHLDVQLILDTIGQSLNMPEFSEIIKMPILEQMQQATLAQMGLMAAPQQPAAMEPGQIRMGRSGPRSLPASRQDGYIQQARIEGRQVSEPVR